MKIKRILSMLLAVVMVIGTMPVVLAAEFTETPLEGLEVAGLAVTRSQFMKNFDYSSNETAGFDYDRYLTVRKDSIVGVIKANAASAVGVILTFTNNSGQKATLSFNCKLENNNATYGGYYTIGDVKYEAPDVTESFQIPLNAGETVVVELCSPKRGKYISTFNITDINLITEGAQNVEATFGKPENGTYTVQSSKDDVAKEITENETVTVAAGTKYTLKATAAEGYQFFGWSNGTSYVSYQAEYEFTMSQNIALHPVFLPVDVALFQVGMEQFDNLTDANAYATNNGGLIVLLNDGTITGEHTISAGNTLLIPYNDRNTVHTEATSTAIDKGGSWENVAYETPTAYRVLTMAAGAKLIVNGYLNVGGRHSSGPFLTAGSPSGQLGMIRMAEGSNITVNNGGVLYCWGYIYGGGTVTAENGSTVHENIQFADFRGGNATAGIAQTFLVFPMTQYYVQNIEVATTYMYGAVENVWCSLYMATGSQVYGTNIQFIGSNKDKAMFVPEEGGSVTKTYIPSTDRLQIDIDGNGSINPMTLDMEIITQYMGGPLNTKTFVLPITNNMTINVNSGKTTVNQSLALLPGVELTIAEGAILNLNGCSEEDIFFNESLGFGYQGGHNLIVYGRDQWFSGFTMEGEFVDTYYVYSGKRLQPVAYSPTRTCTRTEDSLVDAVVDINGTLITDGFLYTTVGIDFAVDENGDYVLDENGDPVMIYTGNTPIISSGKTGKVVMNNGAGMDFVTLQATQDGTDPVFTMIMISSARLQNADGSYLDTLGAEAGATFNYCAKCGEWYAVSDEPHTVEITWLVDGKDTTQEFCMGMQLVYLDGQQMPTKEGYEFIGWSTENDNVPEFTSATLPVATQDAVYYAIFVKLIDLDGDGDMDEEDMTLFARHIGGIEAITDETVLAAMDINGDGIISAYDLAIFTQNYVKLYNYHNK